MVYTDHQRLELEKEFHYSRYITIRRKSELAANLGLTERQVSVGPLLQLLEQYCESGLQATRQIMELSQGRTERLSPGHGHTTEQELSCCHESLGQ